MTNLLLICQKSSDYFCTVRNTEYGKTIFIFLVRQQCRAPERERIMLVYPPEVVGELGSEVVNVVRQDLRSDP